MGMQLRFLAGISTAFAFKLLLMRALTLKLQRDIEALNNGDYRPLLSSFHRDAVLKFADGDAAARPSKNSSRTSSLPESKARSRKSTAAAHPGV